VNGQVSGRDLAGSSGVTLIFLGYEGAIMAQAVTALTHLDIHVSYVLGRAARPRQGRTPYGVARWRPFMGGMSP
jgi:hypothetical protein